MEDEVFFSMVQEFYRNMKSIAEKHPNQAVGQGSIDTFNSVLKQAKEKIKDNPIVQEMSSLFIPRSTGMGEIPTRIKVVDLSTKMSVIYAAVRDYMEKTEDDSEEEG